jgi:RNA polymerase sigma factor (sigma-70 family)
MTASAVGASAFADRASVLAAQRGDDAALESVVTKLAHELLPLALALTGGSGDADRLVGDTLSHVYERLHQLDEPAAILVWARRILVRRFLDERRWSLRRPHCSIESVQVAGGTAPRPELIDVRVAVDLLPKRDRALLALHYWQRLSIAECAAELGIPEGTVKSRLNSALTRLRRVLKEEGA